MKIRRINLLSGPGCGKSTNAAMLFAELKKANKCEVELIQEHVKVWAYENRHPESFDQVYLMGMQMRAEDILLRNNVDVVISESPILMSATYGKHFNAPGWKHLIAIANEFEAVYPSLNIFLKRGKEYNNKGRWQNEEQAIVLDKEIRDVHIENGLALYEIPYRNTETIIKTAFEALGI